MRLNIRHTSRYQFDAPVYYGLQQLRKTPKTTQQQTIVSWETHITGGQKELSYHDHHNNVVELVSFDRDATDVTIESNGTVEVHETHGVLGPHRGFAPLWLYLRATPLTRAGPLCKNLIKDINEATPLARLHALSTSILDAAKYEIGTSHPGWTAEDVLTHGVGVCQDHAHVFIACAREMRIPARYVSGYLMLDDRVDQDASHAWAEAFVPDLGWVGFDISNGISPDIRYVRVATGLDYPEAAPITGTRLGGTGESLSVQIMVAQQ